MPAIRGNFLLCISEGERRRLAGIRRHLASVLKKDRPAGRRHSPSHADASSRHILAIEELLETGEHLPDFLRRTEVGHRIGNGVVVFQFQQR